MRANPIKTVYSSNSSYRYEIIRRKDGLYQVWLQMKIQDTDYFGEEYICWTDTLDYAHLADTYERAEEIGNEGLVNLTGSK